MQKSKLEEYIDVKELLALQKFNTAMTIGAKGAFLSFFGVNSEELHTVFMDYLQEEYQCKIFDFQTEKPFDEFLSIETTENFIFDLYHIPDQFNIDTIIRNFRFNRDFITERKLRIFIVASHTTLDIFNEIAYDFVSFNNFYGVFHDQSVNTTYKIDRSKLDDSIQKFKSLPKGTDNRIQFEYLIKIIDNAIDIDSDKEAFKYIRFAEKKAKKIQEPFGLAYLLSRKAGLYFKLGKLDIAISYYKEALPLSTKSETIGLHTDIVKNLGTVYLSKNDFDKAKEYFEKALKLYIEDDNISGQANVYSSMAGMFFNEYKLDESLEYYFKSKKLYDSLEEESNSSGTFGNIAKVFFKKGLLNEGLKYLEKALVIAKKFSAQHDIMLIFPAKGWYYAIRGDFYKALSYFEESLSLSKKLQVMDEIASSYYNLASMYFDLGMSEKFYELNYLAQNSYKKLSDKKGEADSLVQFASFENENGNYKKAMEYLDKAEKLLSKESKLEKKVYLLFLADLQNNLNEHEKAESILLELLEIDNEIKDFGQILYTKRDLAYTYIKLEKNIEAKKLLDEVLEATKSYEDQYLIASLYINYAYYYKQVGEHTSYLNAYNKAKKIIEHGHYKLLEKKLQRVQK